MADDERRRRSAWVRHDLALAGIDLDVAAADQVADVVDRMVTAGGPGYEAVRAALTEDRRGVDEILLRELIG